MSGKIHHLKTWPQYYNAVKCGSKNFEVRFNDRNFQVGDTLYLYEFVPKNYYKTGPEKGIHTGRMCIRKIMYILADTNFGLQPGYVVLGLSIC